MNKLAILFWKFTKWLIKRGYAYCEERDGGVFLSQGRCGGCNASDVQDWIDDHIDLLKF